MLLKLRKYGVKLGFYMGFHITKKLWKGLESKALRHILYQRKIEIDFQTLPRLQKAAESFFCGEHHTRKIK